MYVWVVMLARGRVFYERKERSKVRRRKEGLLRAGFRIWNVIVGCCLVRVLLLVFWGIFGRRFFET
jgi:hypothetical protein